jgi:hypothetical protein
MTRRPRRLVVTSAVTVTVVEGAGFSGRTIKAFVAGK